LENKLTNLHLSSILGLIAGEHFPACVLFFIGSATTGKGEPADSGENLVGTMKEVLPSRSKPCRVNDILEDMTIA
jgi:hypothetical protein